MTSPGEGLNGNSWFVKEIPYLYQDGSGNIAVVGLINDTLWFDRSGSAPNYTYTGRYFIRETLTQDSANQQFLLRDDQGQLMKFFDFTVTPAAKQGQFKSFTDAAGREIVASYGTNNLISSFVQSSGSVSSGYYYAYYSGGASDKRLQSVTLNVSGMDVRRAYYDYYDGTDSYGSAGDLRRAQIQIWTGSAWSTIATHYYRYYKSGDPNGVVNGLKYVLSPYGYAAMVAAGITPETSTDVQIKAYAKHCFQFNTDRSVYAEIVNANALNYGYAYSSSGFSNGMNNWKIKTIETLPDGNRQSVYTNYVGLVILKATIRMSGGVETGDKWYEYYQYDSAGRVTLVANSSAVQSVNEGTAGLVTLNSATGFIRTYAYYSSSPPTGGAPGYLQYESIQQGSGGSSIHLKQLAYTAQTVGGVTIYVPWKEICYPSDTNQLLQIQCTVFTYTWQGSSFQFATRTTTFPLIGTNENGSGAANSRTEQFDAYRQLIWVLDELGYITGNTYDLATGGLTQLIQDASSGTPWTPLPGTHLNLTTNLTVDAYGRITQSLGPTHNIDIGGTSTSVRRAQWTVYDDVNLQVRVGAGYQKTSDSSFTLINPVRITQLDEAGRVTDEISATRASTSGALLPTDTFAQSTYVRWQKNLYDQSPGLGSSRVYFLIPSSGNGSPGTNYNESGIGYDIMRRVIREVTASGTITRYVFNTMGWVLETWVGTNDAGASDSDPSGGGYPGNTMVRVSANQYDGGAAGGDGNITQTTLYANASDTRTTTYAYDFRNRRTSATGQINFYEEYVYDNLDRVIQTNRKDTSGSGTLVGQSKTNFDDLGRVYQRLVYAVSGGVAGNALMEKTWYSATGQVIKRVPMGAQFFQKSMYDAVGRVSKSYQCYNTAELDTDYTSAEIVTNNTVLRQVESTYDAASNLILSTTRERFHNATGLGDLTSPSGAQPQARVTYLALYPDAIGRSQSVANYGTNGASSYTRSDTIPARSDAILITSTLYNSRGEAYQTIDPKGTMTQQAFDDANRRTQLIENYVSGGTNPDQNRETDFTYTPDNQLATLTAKNSVTGDQVTTWTYGTTLSDSDVASNDLLRYKQYPDGSSTNRMEYKYNGLGEAKEVGDQNGTVRTLEYDKLGRPANDRVTTVGTGVDTAVLRISRSYEVRGLLQNVTSYDNATVGSGNVVNDIQYSYNGFMLLTNEYQSHSGAVNTSTTAQVQYGYADGSSNTARRTSMTNPDGTQLAYQYDSIGSAADVLNRVAHLQSGNAMGVDYSYLGVGTPVICGYSCEPSVELTYYTSGGSGDAGDQYTGLDRFGRVVDQRWRKTSDNTDRERLKYGYDRASNRQWRQNTVAGTGQDEYYTYDGLYQVKTLQRGTLTGSPPTGISGTPSWEEDWNFDPLGNWNGTSSAYITKVTGSTTLNQNRTHSVANEITGISTTTGTSWPTPVHNLVGNMTKTPQPLSLGSSYDLVWDPWNRLVQVTSSGNFVARYAYDGANRRVSKLTGSQFRHYFYSDQWQIIEERTGSNANADRRFFWGVRGIDDLICRDRGPLERLYALSDGLNITAVVDVNGFVQERYGFDGFGGVRYMDASFGTRTSSNYDWETLFGGYRYDQETGLYQVRYRYLHSKLGRWLSRDPLGELGFQGWVFGGAGFPYLAPGHSIYRDLKAEVIAIVQNMYEYVLNGPINYSDPRGLDKFTVDQIAGDDPKKRRQISRGCVGIAAWYQSEGCTQPATWPEFAPNTSCYLSEDQASAYKCDENRKPFVFAKQGDWYNNAPPVVNQDGTVPNNSIRGWDNGVYNYVSKLPDGYYWADHGVSVVFPDRPETVFRDDTPPKPAGKYPHEIWCVTCKCKH